MNKKSRLFLPIILILLTCLNCKDSSQPKVMECITVDKRPFGTNYLDGEYYYSCLFIEVCYPKEPETKIIQSEPGKIWIVEEKGTYKVVTYDDSKNPHRGSGNRMTFQQYIKSDDYRKENPYNVVLFSADVPILEKDRFSGIKKKNGEMLYYRDYKFRDE
jgi:hypothetical protein